MTQLRSRASLWVAIVAACVRLAAAAPPLGYHEKQVRFTRLATEHGLSQGTVNSIVQDRHGFLWFGTQDGLNRYDGHDFVVYRHDPEDARSLSNSFVWAVLEDRNGRLWIGTDGGGLNRMESNGRHFTAFRHDPDDPGSLSADRVRALHEGHDGSLWIGTDGGGLSRLDPSTGIFEHFRHDPADEASPGADRVRGIHQDRAGRVWVATYGGGLGRLDPATGRFTRYHSYPEDPTSLPDRFLRTVYEDRNGALWVGTYHRGVARLDPQTGRFTHFSHDPQNPHSLSHNRVRAFFQDDNGSLWVGTDDGLNLWLPEVRGFSRLKNDPTDPRSLSHDRVISIAQDRGGVLWVAAEGGLNRWNIHTGHFRHIRQEPWTENTLSNNVVKAIQEGPDGALWVGTFGGGLSRIDRETGQFSHFRHDRNDRRSISDDRIMSLLVDRKGQIWAGTLDRGLNRLDPQTGRATRFRHDEADEGSLGADGVAALHQDTQGRIWVGCFGGGLNRLDPGGTRFIRYRHDPEDPRSISNDRITVILESQSGALWVGTDGGGLNRLDLASGEFDRFRHDAQDPTSLSSDVVFSLHEDRHGRLWVGTQDAGLNLLDPASAGDGRRFKRYSRREGLVNDCLYGILEDSRSRLWLSSNAGLIRFDPAEESFRNYDASYGLQGNEFNFGAHHRAPSGEMFFGGPGGLTAFHPERVEDNQHQPPVVLTSVRKLHKEIELDRPVAALEDLTVGHRDSVVAFGFAALDFTAPERNRYLYRLDGFDEDWIEAGRARQAVYTNLHAGTYTFRVRGSNNDGVWSGEELQLGVRVQPPPWKTWWAYTLYALALIGVIAVLVRATLNKLRREAEYSRKLEAEVESRTRELAERAEELASLNSRLEQASLTDSLTGLRNRRFLLQYAREDTSRILRTYRKFRQSETQEDPPSLSFLMVDLDGFKEINDTHGHAAGDSVLIQVRDVLQDASRTSDTVIRWGGDEFLVVGKSGVPEGVEVVAERIRRSLQDAPLILDNGLEVYVRCSIGFASYPFLPSAAGALTWEHVLAIADRALYAAKNSGRNAWVGILSRPDTPTEGLLECVLDNPDECRRRGMITVQSSLDPGSLVWEPDLRRRNLA